MILLGRDWYAAAEAALAHTIEVTRVEPYWHATCSCGEYEWHGNSLAGIEAAAKRHVRAESLA